MNRALGSQGGRSPWTAPDALVRLLRSWRGGRPGGRPRTRASAFLLFVLSAALFAGQAPQAYAPAEKPAVSRAALETIEKQFDVAIVSLDVNDPYDVLGYTRGVYLPGYGVVFTAEVNLVITPLSPFSPQPQGAALVKLHGKKLGRLVVLKRVMRDAMVASAASLDTIPPNEQIVIAVSLFYRGFEQRKDLPNQIVMQAPRQTLLDFKAGRLNEQALDAAVKVKEL